MLLYSRGEWNEHNCKGISKSNINDTCNDIINNVYIYTWNRHISDIFTYKVTKNIYKKELLN